ncbi:unnamed protein product [Lathyrus oleraceus]
MLHLHQGCVKHLALKRKLEFGSGVLFYDRLYNGLNFTDAIGSKGCREIEGPYVDYIEEQFAKPVLLSGPVLPEPSKTVLPK